jgi:two-component system alkaline phosphatase synthesis response regulator PhoP
MGAAKILIVEDEPNMVAGLRDNFEYEGFQVLTALDGVEGLERALKESPDLIVLDVMMPRMSGLDVCKQLKAKRPSIPIIMLTARGQEVDKVVGLELGADDYVTKPFSPRELLARVRAAFRRLNQASDKIEAFGFDDVEVNFSRMELHRAGQLVPLTPQEFKMLRFFLNNPERVITRTELLNEVWGYNNYPTTRTVDTHILRLRQKLERDPTDPVHFRTVHGTGYKFVR